jgi:gluconolactonase
VIVPSSEKFDLIRPEDSALERLATGVLTEGPLWNVAAGFLLFSDISANCIYQWSPGDGVTVFRSPSGNANGLTYDRAGGLLMCEHGNRRLSRLDRDGTYTVTIDRFQGKRLNSPNDVVVKSDGTIYFTDPPYAIPPEAQELPFQGVFRFDPARQTATLLADDFDRPNGLAFSPDERSLYIADSTRQHVRVFAVHPDGTLGANRVFAETHSASPGVPDGMKVDVQGNLYVVAAGGVWVFSPGGERLGIIHVPDPRPTNCAWGDQDGKTLFITARTAIYRIKLCIPGIRTP